MLDDWLVQEQGQDALSFLSCCGVGGRCTKGSWYWRTAPRRRSTPACGARRPALRPGCRALVCPPVRVLPGLHHPQHWLRYPLEKTCSLLVLHATFTYICRGRPHVVTRHHDAVSSVPAACAAVHTTIQDRGWHAQMTSASSASTSTCRAPEAPTMYLQWATWRPPWRIRGPRPGSSRSDRGRRWLRTCAGTPASFPPAAERTTYAVRSCLQASQPVAQSSS